MKRRAARIARFLKSTCQHPNTIELQDGVKVCTRCEAVIQPAAVWS
jgi:hypothetical protein